VTPEQEERFARLVKLLGTLLIARKDVKAIEHPKLGWMPHRERAPRGTKAADMPCIPFRMQDFRDHLTGKTCMGTYLLSPENNVKFFAIDLDLKTSNAVMFEMVEQSRLDEMLQSWKADTDKYAAELGIDKMYKGNIEEALHDPEHVGYRWARFILKGQIEVITAAVAKQLGLPVIPVITGGGAHVIVPTGLIPAVEARAAANVVMEEVGWELFKGDCFFRPRGNDQFGIEAEVFPKQDTLGGAGTFGNLIRLPLGWHAGANIRTYLLDTQTKGQPWDLPAASPIPLLEQVSSAMGVSV
jgi:hypothetical protein